MTRFHLNVMFAALVLAATHQAQAADPPACGELPCRVSGLPYVSERGGILLEANTRLYVEFVVQGDKVVSVVPRNAKPRRGSNVLFNALGTARGLNWANLGDQPFAFDVEIVAPERGRPPISSCTAAPDGSGHMVWEGPAQVVELINFRFASTEAPLCK